MRAELKARVPAVAKGSLPVAVREDWFDRLARAAARNRTAGVDEGRGNVSRRDAVGFFAGTTAMAILGSWAMPRRAFSASPGRGDPGCSGIRTFYKAGCAKPVPKLAPYRPAVNGCGPQNGFNPVPQAPLFIANFSSACDGHDRGYGTCNVPKEVTDAKFLEDMKAICAGPGTPVSGLFMSLLELQCVRNAEIFYTAVSELGDDPYKEGQAEGCDCCEECPGGGVKCNGVCCRPGLTCSEKGRCCNSTCDNGWVKCPYPNAICGFGCCNPATPVCCPGVSVGSLRCCPGGCFKGGCA